MKTGVVQSAFVVNASRFDSSFHLSGGVQSKAQILRSLYGICTIGDASKDIFYGGRNRRIYVTSKAHGIPFLSSSSILKADLSDAKMVSKKLTPNIQEQLLEKDWILISRSGTIGNTAYTNEIYAQKLASEDIIRVIPNNILRAGYMYAFLSSKYGYNLLTQGTFGAVIQHIEPSHVSQIPIPLFPAEFQNKIDAQIKEAAALRVEANKLLEEAKRKVEEFVGVVFNKQTGYKTQSVSIQDVHKSFQLRLDPPAIISDSIKIMDRIKNSTVQLGDCKVDVWYPGVFKRTYTKNGVPYIKGSELMMTDPFKRCERLSKSRTPNIEQLYLKEDYILITCAGACGDVKLITKEYEEQTSIGSPDIVRVKANDSLFTSGYLFAYLKSKLVYEYMQSMKYGSVIERFDADHVRTIPIVKPTKELSNEVSALIDKYKDCTYKAYCLERSAIKAVEDEIDSWGK